MSSDDDMYGQVIAMPWMAARAKAVSSTEADPEKASRAMELSEATGVNVGAIYANTEEFEKSHKQALTGQIINDNKHLANYVNSHPLAADISSDDWGKLDTFSKTLERYSAGFSLPKKFLSTMADVWHESRDTASVEGMAKALGVGVPKGLINLPIQTPSGMGADQVITAFENLNKAIGFAPQLPEHIPRTSEVLQQTIENITGPWYKPKNPLEEVAQTVGEFAPFVAAPSGEAKLAERFLKNVVIPALGSEFGKRWAEKAGYPELGEAAAMAGMLTAGALGHGLSFGKGKAVEKPPQQNEELTRAMTTAEPFISAGEEPPPYLHPEIDKMKADQAKEDSKALDEALAEATASATRERNPKMFADFTRQQVQGEIGIPFDALGDLYGTKEIHPEDGLLGWVPDIVAKVRAAAVTGGDIKVPIADWLAHVEPEVAKELKDDIRFRDGGFTLSEASEAHKIHAAIKETFPEPEKIEGEEPTVEPIPDKNGQAVKSVKAMAGLEREQWVEDMKAEMPHIFDIDLESPKEFLANDFDGKVMTVMSKGTSTVAEMASQTPYGTVSGQLHRFNQLIKDTINKFAGDTKVHIVDDAFFDDKLGFKGYNGYYDVQNHVILLPESAYYSGNFRQIFLHETIHAATARVLEARPELQDRISGIMLALHDINPELKKTYGFTDEHEFLAEAFSNKDFQAELAKIALPKEVGEKLGLTGKLHSAWDAVVDFVRKALGIPEEEISALEAAVRFFSEAAESELTKKDYGRLKRKKMLPSKAPDAGEGAQPELPGTTRQEDLPPFTPQSMGMTKPQFAKYIALIKRLDKEDQAYQLEKALEEERKRQTPEWKAAEKEVINDVKQGLSDNQHLNAWNFLTTGFVDGEKTRKARLNADKLTDEQKARLPKDFVGKGGIDPDDAASMLGYDSGGKLVERMSLLNEAKGDLTIEQFRDRQVKQQVAEVMKRKFGDLDENILSEAKDHVISTSQLDMLHEETVARAMLAGHEIPFSKEETKSWAKEEFSRLPADEVSRDRFLKEAGKAGKLAELEILKSHLGAEDPASMLEAFKQKQRQYHSMLLAAEAKKFEKERKRAEKMIDRYSKRASFKSVEQEFTDHVHELLMRVGADVRRTPENLALSLQGENYDQFANRINNAGGGVFDPQSPPGKKLEDFTVDEYRDFAKALKSLDYNGRRAKKIEVAWKELEHKDVVEGIDENLEELAKKGFDPTKRGLIGATRRFGRNIDARLVKMEQLADWIDQNDPRGWFNQSVVRPLYFAQGRKGDTIAAIASDIKGIEVSREWGKALPDRVFNNVLKDKDGIMPLTNENKIVIALNWGNESNRSVLTRGMDWQPHEVQAFLDANMTDMDWKFVRGIWDMLGKHVAPLVEEATTKRSGVSIEMVQPVDVQAMGKTISGGYYPLLKDPRAQLLGEQKETELVNKPMFSPLPMARALKLRTGIAYPIDLSLNALNTVISETIHASIFQDPVANARKVVGDSTIRKGVDKAFGPEYVKQLDLWLDDIANNGGEKSRSDDGKNWISRNMRENVVFGLMGYKLSTAAIHGMSAGASSIYEVGALRLTRAIKDLGLAQFLPDVARRMYSNPDKTWETVDWAHQTFPELRNRNRDIGRDMQAQLRKLVSTGYADDFARIRAANIAWSMKMVATLDQLTATPTAIAAYTKAITEGLSHEDAVYAGEKAVRTAHGSPSLVGRANIGRGELGKWATIAYNGYWNHNYNRFRSAIRDVKAPDIDFSDRLWLGSAALSALIIAPAIAHYAVRGSDDASYTSMLGESIASQFGGQVPLVNSLVFSFMHNRDPHLSPFDEAFKGTMQVMKDLKQMYNGQKAEKFVKHAFTAPGFLVGIGASDQIGTAMQFIRDVYNQKEHPKTMMDWASGLITGGVNKKHVSPIERGLRIITGNK